MQQNRRFIAHNSQSEHGSGHVALETTFFGAKKINSDHTLQKDARSDEAFCLAMKFHWSSRNQKSSAIQCYCKSMTSLTNKNKRNLLHFNVNRKRCIFPILVCSDTYRTTCTSGPWSPFKIEQNFVIISICRFNGFSLLLSLIFL